MSPSPNRLVTQSADDFCSGTFDRIVRFMVVLAVLASNAVFLRWGWLMGAGFLSGCALAYVNFLWLKRGVSALADRVTATGKPQPTKGVVVGFLLRYVLIAAVAYVIFRLSSRSLYGMLAGLFLPVGGIFCEAIYEGVVAVRRGSN